MFVSVSEDGRRVVTVYSHWHKLFWQSNLRMEGSCFFCFSYFYLGESLFCFCTVWDTIHNGGKVKAAEAWRRWSHCTRSWKKNAMKACLRSPSHHFLYSPGFQYRKWYYSMWVNISISINLIKIVLLGMARNLIPRWFKISSRSQLRLTFTFTHSLLFPLTLICPLTHRHKLKQHEYGCNCPI